jgi:hypothetical protein
MYKACTYETYCRMLTLEGFVTVRANHQRHLDRSPIDAHVSLSHLQRTVWAAA